ncbi:MAG: GNAT family N-acetyltransferase [bacterium]|nr:GNAT family N-acetyltransferase [bacterium]
MSWKLRHVTHQSPAADTQQVLRFSYGDYVWATRSRLEAPWGNETYEFVAAFDGDLCVGTTSCTISPRKQGILSQVFTDPDYRGQGIATTIVREAVETFRKHNTRAAYLASGKDWVRQMYQKFGFQFVGAMAQRHAFKLTLDPAGEDSALFRPGQQTTIRPMQPHDQADLCSLFNAQHNCIVKHYALSGYLGSYFEGEFYTLRLQSNNPGFQSLVLDGEETPLGLATILPSQRRHETHHGTLDLVVHPDYTTHSADLLDAVLSNCPLDLLSAYIADSETQKKSLLERAGFHPVTTLKRHIKIETETFDLTLYQKHL